MRRLDLRRLLRIDSALCVATGAALAIAVDGWVRAVGVFLVFYGVDLALLARARSARVLRGGTALTAVGDVAWVLATVAVVAAGAFDTTAGAVVALVLAVPVLAMGALKTPALAAG